MTAKPPLMLSPRGVAAAGGVIHAPGEPGAPPLRKIPIDEVPAVMVPSAVARRRRAWATPASGQPRGEAGRDLGAVVRPGRDDPQGGVNGFALQVRVATSSVPGSP